MSAACGASISLVCRTPKYYPVPWVNDAGWRSSGDILTIPIIIYVVCAISLLRLNIPRPGTSQWRIFLGKLGWTLRSLFWPESIAWVAASDFAAAVRHRDSMNTLLATTDDGVKWTLTHAFFANMGGFILSSPTPGKEDIILNGAMLEVLVREKIILVPEIEEATLKDRSKTNMGIVVIGTVESLYLLAQLIVRLVYGLPFATTEFMPVLYFWICCWIYGLQWNKPKGLETRETICVAKTLDPALLCMLEEATESENLERNGRVLRAMPNRSRFDTLLGKDVTVSRQTIIALSLLAGALMTASVLQIVLFRIFIVERQWTYIVHDAFFWGSIAQLIVVAVWPVATWISLRFTTVKGWGTSGASFGRCVKWVLVFIYCAVRLWTFAATLMLVALLPAAAYYTTFSMTGSQ